MLSPRVRDEALEDSANLPDPDVMATEIIEDLEKVFEQFRLIGEDRGEKEAPENADKLVLV